jgi:hypothetical protein
MAAIKAHAVLFARRYRAALLDYLLGAGELGLARAYDLGRTAINEGVSLLHLLQTHHKATNSVLHSSANVDDALGKLEAAEAFLAEALSPYELTYRGYLALAPGNALR